MHAVCTVRAATAEDLPKIRKLIGLSSELSHEVAQAVSSTTWPGDRQVLVVDAAHDELAAVAVIAFAPPLAHLEALVMSSGCASSELEARVLGVSEALAQAFGCTSLDVPARVAA
jgi:hypothetical protein